MSVAKWAFQRQPPGPDQNQANYRPVGLPDAQRRQSGNQGPKCPIVSDWKLFWNFGRFGAKIRFAPVFEARLLRERCFCGWPDLRWGVPEEGNACFLLESAHDLPKIWCLYADVPGVPKFIFKLCFAKSGRFFKKVKFGRFGHRKRHFDHYFEGKWRILGED